MRTIKGRAARLTLMAMVCASALGAGATPAAAEAAPSELMLTATPDFGVWGTTFTFTAAATCAGVPLAGAPIAVQRESIFTGGWSEIARGTTDDQGLFVFTDKPADTPRYYAAFEGTDECGASSAITSVRVRPGIALNPLLSTVTAGSAVRLSGRVLPALPGQYVVLQVLNGVTGQWRSVSKATLDLNSEYRFTYRANRNGFLIFRVAYPSQTSSHMWNLSRNVRADWVPVAVPSGSGGKPVSGRRCHPAYTGACLDPSVSDYDCYGGGGDGPRYTDRVFLPDPANDPYDLDEVGRVGDGIGCNSRPHTGRTY